MTAPAHSPFWLHPLFLLTCTLGVPSLATYYLPEQIFQTEWRCPKYFSTDSALMIAAVLMTFALGLAGYSLLRALLRSRGYAPSGRPGIVGLDQVMRIAFWTSAFLTLAGTMIWAIFAARQGVSLSDAVAALHGQGGAVLSIRRKAETIPGITTLTQFGMAAGILAGILWFRARSTPIRIALLAIVGAGLLRGLLRAERLAFIEVAVPFLVSVLPEASIRYGSRRLFRAALQLVPAVAVAGLVGFFILAEAGRSYEAKLEEGEQHTALEYGAIRLGGYYGTSLNNGAYLFQHLPASRFPYFSFVWLWRFPGVKAILSPREVTGMDGSELNSLVTLDLNIEFNNPSGIFSYEHDFGRDGLLVAALLAGIFAGWLHARYRDGAAAGRLLYPMIVIGLLEISRIPYLTDSRAFPSLAFLAFLVGTGLLVRSTRSQVQPASALLPSAYSNRSH